jgi:hypothetical protein
MATRLRTRYALFNEDAALLAAAAERFGLSQSEVVRRLLRAAMDVGPALSEENSQTVHALTGQVRRVGLNLAQMLHAVHAGRVVTMKDAEPVWDRLRDVYLGIEAELRAMTEAYGVRLRRAAGVSAKGDPK